MCIPKLETYFGHQDQSLLDRHNTLLLYHDEDDIYQSDQSDVDDIDDIFVSDEETDDDIEEEHYGGIRQALIQSSDQYHHQSTNQQYQSEHESESDSENETFIFLSEKVENIISI